MTTPEEVLAVIEEGKANRHVSVTSEPLQNTPYPTVNNEIEWHENEN